MRGIAIAENGVRLVVDDPELRRGRSETVRFGVVDASGETVRDFDVEHTKRMHVIVALREGDLAFLHVHPTDDRAAAFAATFPTAGRYRLFLQFKHRGRVHTVAYTQEVR